MGLMISAIHFVTYHVLHVEMRWSQCLFTRVDNNRYMWFCGGIWFNWILFNSGQIHMHWSVKVMVFVTIVELTEFLMLYLFLTQCKELAEFLHCNWNEHPFSTETANTKICISEICLTWSLNRSATRLWIRWPKFGKSLPTPTLLQETLTSTFR